MRGIMKISFYQSVGTLGLMMLPISITWTLEEHITENERRKKEREERKRGKESGRKG